MKTLLKNLVVVLIAMLVGAATVIGYLHAQPTPTLVAQVASAAPSSQVALDESTVEGIYQKLSPSIVTITSTISGTNSNSTPTPRRNPFPFGTPPNNRQQQGTGSGIIIDTNGDILTNNHVVAGATSIDVTFANGNTVSGKVLGTDAGNDLAVVKIDPTGQSLTPAPLGDSSQLKVGQTALAIGNPFDLSGSLTMGIISALGRTYGSGTNGRPISNMIQTDAAINPGNSGGALIDSAGQVIGITSEIDSPVDANVGVGFAIPINTAKSSLPAMIAGTTISQPWLGISGTEVTPSLASQLNIPVGGVYVDQVLPNSPAAAAGLHGASGAQTNNATSTVPSGGDVILAVDGNKVNKVEDILSYLNTKKVGDTITLTIRRNGQNQDVKVTLAAWPANLPQQ